MATLPELTLAGMLRLVQLLKGVRDSLDAKIGNRASLSTVAKSDLVSAINEVQASITGLSQIDDTTAAANKTFSSNKINALMNQLKSDILNGADADHDSLKELQDAILAVAQADAGLVSAMQAQNFDTLEQAQGRANIGAAAAADLGDLTGLDFVADINTAFATGS